MSFPIDLKTSKGVVTQMRRVVKIAQGELERFQKEKELAERILAILNGLRNSWKNPHAGDGADTYFFVGADRRSWVVARQFLPKRTKICRSRDEWKEKYEKYCPGSTPDHKVVPPFWPVVDLADVATNECEKCHQLLPLIEHDIELSSSPGGSDSEMTKMVLCLQCNHITVVSTCSY